MPGVKDHKHLMTICPCCPCCCILTSMPLAAREARDMLVKLEGVSVEITDKCNECGLCAAVCIFDQVSITDGVAVIGEGCGRCATVCKHDGVSITIDNQDYVKECVERISALVDVR